MSILIGGDFVPTESNVSLFNKCDLDELFGDPLQNIMKTVDLRVFNLETPLADELHPILKCGPNLCAPVNAVNTFCAIGVDLFTLANNHIMDQGIEGLESTEKALKDNNIEYVGVGCNIYEASEPYFVTINGKKYCFFACTDHEFSVCDEHKAGANPFDPIVSFDQVQRACEACDYLIVLYHGGKEHYRYPSPRLQKICRKFVDSGANLVICQHSHCIGCEEKYNRSTIVYGQGNFLFDHSDSEFWKTGLLIRINEDDHIDYIPIIKRTNGVRLADDSIGERIMNDFRERSKEILLPGVIQKKYKDFADEMLDWYLNVLLKEETTLFRIINKLTMNKMRIRRNKKMRNTEFLVKLLNFTECEAHNELFVQGIKGAIK